jgi:hypothetical protein
MRKNKFFPFGEVEVRISNVELPTLLTSRYCFTLCILDDDRNPIYRKEVVVHCVLEDATTDENFQILIGKMLKKIESHIPKKKGEKEKFQHFIEELKNELYKYAEDTKPIFTLF